MLNAIGLANPGRERFLADHLPRLGKPFREEQLARAIDDVMAASRARAGIVAEVPSALVASVAGEA